MKIALILAPQDFKDEEFFVCREYFTKKDIEAPVVCTKFGPAQGVDGAEVKVDILAKNLKLDEYKAIVLIGGPGAVKYKEDEQILHIVQQAVEKNKVVGAICIAPVVLAQAGVLEGRQATVWSSKTDQSAVKQIKDKGAYYIKELDVVVDDNIITANGPKSAKKFARQIISSIS